MESKRLFVSYLAVNLIGVLISWNRAGDPALPGSGTIFWLLHTDLLGLRAAAGSIKAGVWGFMLLNGVARL